MRRQTVRKQTNYSFDATGGVISGQIETPSVSRGSTPVTGVIGGFFANVDDEETRHCQSGANLDCTVESIVNTPGGDSATFPAFKTRTERNVDYWGEAANCASVRSRRPCRMLAVTCSASVTSASVARSVALIRITN